MGSVSSVSMAYSDEWEETKTLIEDLSETGEKEEGECGLCRYIKEGECKDAFIELVKCAEKTGESDVTKCKKARVMFKTCMYDNPVYYEPIITNEAREIAKMLNQLQAEKEAILVGEAAAIAKALSKLQTAEQPSLPPVGKEKKASPER